MALELRPNCEWCDKDLPPDCHRCPDLQLRVHLLRRLRRATLGECLPKLRRRVYSQTDPPGDRVAAWPLGCQAPAICPNVSISPTSAEEIATLSARLRDIPPERAAEGGDGIANACALRVAACHCRGITGEAERNDQATQRAGRHGGRSSYGCCGGRELSQARDRAERARAEMAADLELPQVAGHDLRCCRGVRQGRQPT